MLLFVAACVAALNFAVGGLALAQGYLLWGALNVVLGMLILGFILTEES